MSIRKPANPAKILEEGLYAIGTQVHITYKKIKENVPLEAGEIDQLLQHVKGVASIYDTAEAAIASLTQKERAMTEDQLLAEVMTQLKTIAKAEGKDLNQLIKDFGLLDDKS